MSLNNMPAALQPIIQQGFLEQAFQKPLQSYLGFRLVADREDLKTNLGETLTKTRAGLKLPATTPLIASANVTTDNGLTPSTFGVEQYTIAMQS
jgi:hypothetical protein